MSFIINDMSKEDKKMYTDFGYLGFNLDHHFDCRTDFFFFESIFGYELHIDFYDEFICLGFYEGFNTDPIFESTDIKEIWSLIRSNLDILGNIYNERVENE
tara:strand:+ start:1352 stop:1654 length:303 start_codon:yes stop_codon:yes gene_type:complete